jgi:L-ascorbate metabolism protein UlaG (beta-lactamase superfamily)
MIITYYGAEFVKLQFGETVIGIDPISKESKFKSGRFSADLGLVSAKHKDFSGVEALAFGDKTPFVVEGPGEYEISGVTIKGYNSKSKYEGADLYNAIYFINFEDMKICHVGALSDTELGTEAKENLEDIDILFVPIGGEGLLTPDKAYKLCVELSPKIIIPLFAEDNDGKNLKAFLKEAGAEDVKPIDKLTLKKKDLEGKDGEIMVLSPAV